MALRRLDHIGITVADLDAATAFFVRLGLEVEGRTFVEGEFIDTVIGIPEGYGLVGGVGEYENVWRMAHVRGPEGIIVSLSERIG
jgi:catechol 2,3-dioxygenase-like lactoylglutathione lyase family enzyme